MKIQIVKVVIFCLCIQAIIAKNISAQTITVQMDSVRQTIRGFGGMNHTTWIRDLNEDQREKAFGNDPDKIGLSILRIHVDPNPSLFNLELPTALHAKEKGTIIFASP
jgi:glucuronoarabinoxylan endo-1,4-beta-xylanase